MAIDAATGAALQDMVRRESRSLLHYVYESYPWTTPEKRRVLADLQQLIEEEQQGIAALARFLTDHHLPLPYLGAYPMDFTNINFVSLEYLLPILAERQLRALQVLEQDLIGIGDPGARRLVEEMAAMKRRHLGILEALSSGRPETMKV